MALDPTLFASGQMSKTNNFFILWWDTCHSLIGWAKVIFPLLNTLAGHAFHSKIGE